MGYFRYTTIIVYSVTELSGRKSRILTVNIMALKSFISEKEIEEVKKKRQEEWERVRKPDQPLRKSSHVIATAENYADLWTLLLGISRMFLSYKK